MKSIFKKRNQQVEALFESAGSLKKVMCVAFDYAKAMHKCEAKQGHTLAKQGHGETGSYLRLVVNA